MEIKDFSYAYEGRQLFEHVNFEFKEQQMNFLLGQNGMGKSTLLDTIANVDNARTNNFLEFPDETQIAYLSQENSINSELTVNDLITFVQELKNVRKFQTPDVIQKVANIKFGNLSGGERRIVLVFLNAMLERELYLFDEPDSGVDVEHTQKIFEWIRQLIERGKTVIVTTHELSNVLDTDNIVYIKDSNEVINSDYLKIKNYLF